MIMEDDEIGAPHASADGGGGDGVLSMSHDGGMLGTVDDVGGVLRTPGDAGSLLGRAGGKSYTTIECNELRALI